MSSAGGRWRTPRRLLRDPWARAALAVFAVTGTLHLAPAVLSENRDLLIDTCAPLAFLAILLAALRHRLGDLPQVAERHFWNDLTVAFGCWLAVLLLRLTLPAPEPTRFDDLLADFLWAIHYLALLLALERRAHRRGDGRPAGLEQALALPGAAAIFVLGLTGYFIVIPALASPASYDSHLPSFYLYASLDLYLTAVLAYLATTVLSDRWQTIYSLLALAMATFLVTDLLEAVEYATGWECPASLLPLWNVPFLLMVLAARARHAGSAPTASAGISLGPVEGGFSGPSVRTVVTTLALPLIHCAGYASGLLEEATKDLREDLVFWWLLAMGTLALLQHRVLNRKVRTLWRDRLRFVASLRDSEDDLRILVERQHAEVELRRSERRFAEAFRACPDALVIATVRGGRFVEINDSFEETYGYRRAETVGKTFRELGLWARPADRRRITEELERRGSVRDREVELRRASGESRRVLFSAVPITYDDEPCMLSATHDVGGTDSQDLSRPAALLDHADGAICLIDGEGRLTYWNPGCEALYGWRAPDVLGRPLAAMVGLDLAAHHAARDAAADRGEWIGELLQITKEGRELRVGSWWSAVRDPSGDCRGQLISSFEIDGPDGGGSQGISLPPPCFAASPTPDPSSSSSGPSPS